MTRFVQQPDYEGAEFIDLSMASATFREVDLSGARMRGVLLLNADIDGAIDGLRINGVEVMPLIEAELDRLHPERLRLQPATPEAMRDAVDVIEELWQATVRRANALPEASRASSEASSPGWSATISISARSGWPRKDCTLIRPSPAACASNGSDRTAAAASRSNATGLSTRTTLSRSYRAEYHNIMALGLQAEMFSRFLPFLSHATSPCRPEHDPTP